MNRAVGAAQASAQLTADGGDQLNGDARLFFRQGGIVGSGQGIADQILVGDDRGGARLPIENGELAEHCSGRERRQPDVGFVRKMQVRAGTAARNDKHLIARITFAEYHLVAGIRLARHVGLEGLQVLAREAGKQADIVQFHRRRPHVALDT